MGALWVGIDVSKLRLDVAFRPSGEKLACDNDASGIKKLTKMLAARSPQLVVMEATGGHEYAAAVCLSKAGLPVAVANPRQVRAFARAKGKLAKTDPMPRARKASARSMPFSAVSPLPWKNTTTLASLGCV